MYYVVLCLKTSGEAKTLLSISPLTVTDLTSQEDPEKHLFSVSRQIVSDLSIVFTDWGRRLAHMYGNTKLHYNSHISCYGEQTISGKKKKDFLNFLMRFISIKVNCKYHNTLPPTLTFHLFNQLQKHISEYLSVHRTGKLTVITALNSELFKIFQKCQGLVGDSALVN